MIEELRSIASAARQSKAAQLYKEITESCMHRAKDGYRNFKYDLTGLPHAEEVVRRLRASNYAPFYYKDIVTISW